MSRHVTKFRLKEIPDLGMPIAGQLRPAAFELDPKDTVQAQSGLDFDVMVSTDDDKEVLFLEGKLNGKFDLQCVSCLEKFTYDLNIGNYLSDIELDPGTTEVDIAEYLREDALMSIPNYPHCDRDGNDPGRVCPNAGDSFHYESKSDPAAAPEKKDVWGALDDLK